PDRRDHRSAEARVCRPARTMVPGRVERLCPRPVAVAEDPPARDLQPRVHRTVARAAHAWSSTGSAGVDLALFRAVVPDVPRQDAEPACVDASVATGTGIGGLRHLRRVAKMSATSLAFRRPTKAGERIGRGLRRSGLRGSLRLAVALLGRPAYRGRAVAPAAWSAIADSLAHERATAILTKVEEANLPCRRAIEKVGFRAAGVMRLRRIVGRPRVTVELNGVGETTFLAERLAR